MFKIRLLDLTLLSTLTLSNLLDLSHLPLMHPMHLSPCRIMTDLTLRIHRLTVEKSSVIVAVLVIVSHLHRGIRCPDAVAQADIHDVLTCRHLFRVLCDLL